MNPEVESYVKQQLQNGFSEAQIEAALVAKGWRPEDIEKALAAQKQAVALEQIKAFKTTSKSSGSHMKSGIIILLVVIVAMAAAMYYAVSSTVKNNSKNSKTSTSQTSSVNTSPQTSNQSSPDAAAFQQNAQNVSRQNDVAKLAADTADFVSNNEGVLPSGVAAGSSVGVVEICGPSCKTGNPTSVTLDSYQASDISFKSYSANLAVPDLKTIYIVPKGTCKADANGVGTGLGPESTSSRALVFLYALQSSGLEQRCVSL